MITAVNPFAFQGKTQAQSLHASCIFVYWSTELYMKSGYHDLPWRTE